MPEYLLEILNDLDALRSKMAELVLAGDKDFSVRPKLDTAEMRSVISRLAETDGKDKQIEGSTAKMVGLIRHVVAYEAVLDEDLAKTCVMFLAHTGNIDYILSLITKKPRSILAQVATQLASSNRINLTLDPSSHLFSQITSAPDNASASDRIYNFLEYHLPHVSDDEGDKAEDNWKTTKERLLGLIYDANVLQHIKLSILHILFEQSTLDENGDLFEATFDLLLTTNDEEYAFSLAMIILEKSAAVGGLFAGIIGLNRALLSKSIPNLSKVGIIQSIEHFKDQIFDALVGNVVDEFNAIVFIKIWRYIQESPDIRAIINSEL